MQILSLDISNILSIESASLTFEDKGLVLVEGWNFDTQRANGAGKTAIFNCLSYALFEKIPRKISASEILKRGTKQGYVTVSLTCGEDKWTVKRSRPKGVEFFKNDIKTDISQQEFENIIRITYDQFLLTIYTPQSNSGLASRFLISPDSEKKTFILQLLNLDRFVELKKQSDDRVKQFSSLIERDQNLIKNNDARIEAYRESIVDESSISEAILALETMSKQLNTSILEVSSVKAPDLSKYSKIEDDIRTKQAEIAQAKAKRSILHDRYRELISNVHDFNDNDTCSECGSLLDTKDSKDKHEQHQIKIKAKAEDIKNQISSIEDVILKEKNMIDIVQKLREKKSKESEEYNRASSHLSELKSLIKTNSLKKENLVTKLKNNQDLQSKIDNLIEINEGLHKICSENRSQLEIYKTLSNIYSPTGAQAYVLDSVVDSFNEIIQKYIDILSPNMSYILNSYKETSKKDIVAKFSETLTKNGIEVSVGSLSGGEQKGLSLCVDFALLEVLETQFGLALNPIILDEPFDGLDSSGKEIVIELLEQLSKNRQIFVIDHSSEAQSKFPKLIKVELRNDTSTISDYL